jgi:HEAT repeat protein
MPRPLRWSFNVIRQSLSKVLLLIGAFSGLLCGTLPTVYAQSSPSLSALLKACTDKANAGDNTAAFNAVLSLAEALGKAPLTEVKEVLPSILQAVDDKNPTVRTLALSSIVAIQSRSNPDHSLRGDALPLLEPDISRIAAHLTDDDTHIRSTTATVLGGFGSKSSEIVIPPLVAYLKRDDAVSSVGSSVVFQLVRLGPQHPAVSAAIIAFLDRPNQTPECLTSSIDAIAHAQIQNEDIDIDIARRLDTGNPNVRVAIIRDLPELQLPEEVFTTTRTRVRAIASNEQEDPSVRAIANTILPCWVNDRRKPCPTFILPPPTPPSISGPAEDAAAV